VVLDAAWSFTRRDYLHVNSFDAGVLGELESIDSRKRQDDRFFGALALARPVGQYLTIAFGVELIRNLSNIDFFEYSRNIWSLTLSGRW
jgi:hypothetical protein